MAKTIETYTSRDAAKLAGISYRQLDYWCRQGIMGESLQKSLGSGSRRTFTHKDVMVARCCGRLYWALAEYTNNPQGGCLPWYKKVVEAKRQDLCIVKICMGPGVYLCINLEVENIEPDSEGAYK